MHIVTLNPVCINVIEDNIMFTKQNEVASLKLIDFGLSEKYDDRNITMLTDKCGTVIYMAPEVFNNYQYSKVYF